MYDRRERILLTGATGQVGRELSRLLPTLGAVVTPGREELDLARPDSIGPIVRRIRPGLIVNAAAYTDVERAEEEPGVARTVNAIAPGVLAEEAARIGAAIVHFSTDYVFDGEKREPYGEGDPPSPLNVYGETKLAGEEAVCAAGAPHLVFRLSWVYGLRRRNFLTAMLDAFGTREVVRVVDDQTGRPTWCCTVAEAVVGALRGSGPVVRQADPADRVSTSRSCGVPAPTTTLDRVSGLYHLGPAGSTTWHGFAERMLETLRAAGVPLVTRRIEPIPSSEYPSRVRRPRRSVLSCRRFEETFGRILPDWKDELRRCLSGSHLVSGGAGSARLPPPRRGVSPAAERRP